MMKRSTFSLRSDLVQILMMSLIRALAYAVVLSVLFVLGYIVVRGAGALISEFLFSAPQIDMNGGGIRPALIGSVCLIIGSSLISVPIGIVTALYLNEYASNRPLVSIVRAVIGHLAGFPSILFGLFGLALINLLLQPLFGFGPSIVAGSLTLGVMNIPFIIRVTEDSLMSVPCVRREASMALGATKWETICRIVIPDSLPGIVSGILFSMGRVAGEAAPIMFTAGVLNQRGFPGSVFDGVTALPYYLYEISTAAVQNQQSSNFQYGAAITLLMLVFLFNGAGIIVRNSLNKRLKK